MDLVLFWIRRSTESDSSKFAPDEVYSTRCIRILLRASLSWSDSRLFGSVNTGLPLSRSLKFVEVTILFIRPFRCSTWSICATALKLSSANPLGISSISSSFNSACISSSSAASLISFCDVSSELTFESPASAIWNGGLNPKPYTSSWLKN